jgi:hypothetical protein
MASPFAPPCSAPPATQIWVKRFEWEWVPQPPVEDSPPILVPQATCTFLQGDTVLPAIQDWPRWRPSANVKLPLDEYWRLTFVPQVQCLDPTNPDYVGCGVQTQWAPVWTRIETPRAWRWVASCPDLQCQWAAPM